MLKTKSKQSPEESGRRRIPLRRRAWKKRMRRGRDEGRMKLVKLDKKGREEEEDRCRWIRGREEQGRKR